MIPLFKLYKKNELGLNKFNQQHTLSGYIECKITNMKSRDNSGRADFEPSPRKFNQD